METESFGAEQDGPSAWDGQDVSVFCYNAVMFC